MQSPGGRCTTGVLKMHEVTHSTDRPFECDFEGCGKKFKRKDQMRQHGKIHSGIKSFRCDYDGCDASFKTNGSLKYQNCKPVGDQVQYLFYNAVTVDGVLVPEITLHQGYSPIVASLCLPIIVD